VGQCFFANVSLFTVSMVTIKIFVYLLEPRLLNLILIKFLNKPLLFFVRDCICGKTDIMITFNLR
jgi:hypothetical protein